MQCCNGPCFLRLQFTERESSVKVTVESACAQSQGSNIAPRCTAPRSHDVEASVRPSVHGACVRPSPQRAGSATLFIGNYSEPSPPLPAVIHMQMLLNPPLVFFFFVCFGLFVFNPVLGSCFCSVCLLPRLLLLLLFFVPVAKKKTPK